MARRQDNPQQRPTQKLRWVCHCGAQLSGVFGHYDIAYCGTCSTRVWALQPFRDGPFKLFFYPGSWKEVL